MKKIVALFAGLALLVIMLGVGFLAGVLVDRNFGPLLAGRTGQGETAEANSGLNEDLLRQAYELVDRYYVDREAVDPNDLTYGAIAGMVDSLGDTGHSRFMTPEIVAAERKSLQGEFEGIGALVEQRDGYPTIVAPYDNSPAQQAGLKPGDIIAAVDGEETFGQPLSEVISGILGPAGTDVNLTIMDPETGDLREVTITRQRIRIENVTWAMVPGTKIAHIRMAQFSRNVSRDLINALRAAQDQGAEGIIFDLRNNIGGLLDEAETTASQFLQRDQLVLKVRDAEGIVEEIEVERRGVARDIPLVVLVNQGSASAAEIVAGAIQDYERAPLVGNTTFGTGTVLNQFNLDDGSALLLAVQEWLTPDGRVIWHEGIEPDIVVELDENARPLVPREVAELSPAELQNSDDAQLLRAIELLKR